MKFRNFTKNVIMEYLVKVSKKARIPELKRRNMKISNYEDPIRPYRSSDTVSVSLIFVFDSMYMSFLSPDPILLIDYLVFQALSLDESRSPNFNLVSDQEEYSEEEATETMAETMEQYMSKTRADYGSGITRPKIEDKDILDIVDLFHIPKITIDQVMLRAFPISLTGATSRWLKNKPSGLITTWEDLKSKFLSKYCPPARTAKKMEEINNFQQEHDEKLYQAWERFKELLMKCP
ncbi:retrovirus-related pol polyprotein from transposon TNT 1-94 [Tanacetum coccineum]